MLNGPICRWRIYLFNGLVFHVAQLYRCSTLYVSIIQNLLQLARTQANI